MDAIKREHTSIQVDGAGGVARASANDRNQKVGVKTCAGNAPVYRRVPGPGYGYSVVADPPNEIRLENRCVESPGQRVCRVFRSGVKEVGNEVVGVIKGLAPLLNVTWQRVIPAAKTYGLSGTSPMHKVLAGIIHFGYCVPRQLLDSEHHSWTYMQCALDHLHGQRKFSLTAPGSVVMSGIGSVIATGLVETVREGYSHIRAACVPAQERDERLDAISKRKIFTINDAKSLLIAGAIGTAIGGPLCGLGTVAGSVITQTAVRVGSRYLANSRLGRNKPLLSRLCRPVTKLYQKLYRNLPAVSFRLIIEIGAENTRADPGAR